MFKILFKPSNIHFFTYDPQRKVINIIYVPCVVIQLLWNKLWCKNWTNILYRIMNFFSNGCPTLYLHIYILFFLGYIWGRACWSPYPNVKFLKAAIEAEWQTCQQTFLVKVCCNLWPRVEAVIIAQSWNLAYGRTND